MTPILVRWLYVLALVVITFGTLFGLLWVWSFASWMGWAMWLATPIIVGLGLAVLLVVSSSANTSSPKPNLSSRRHP
ncbi:hypothetical protein ACFYYL_43075 [Actinomadura geliboluensis]|uniref:hypothetical protein n=1 Tax=Actinomadura geliboluensis TaxID=882440 RepID=UPI003687F15F